MKIPESVASFCTQAQWNSLKLDRLDPEDRKAVVEVVEAGFEGDKPDDVDNEAVGEVLALAREFSDMLATQFDESGYDAEEVGAAASTASEILDEDASEGPEEA